MRYQPAQQNRAKVFKRFAGILGSIACTLICVACSAPPAKPLATPVPAASPINTPVLNPAALTQLPAIINRDLTDSGIPGAVVVIGTREQILFQQSFGVRAFSENKLPATTEAMSDDTIFDLASLTKVLATTTAVMQLVEQNKLQLDAPVARYWPAFGANGKSLLTVRHLLTHYSGLRAEISQRGHWQGYADAMRLIEAEKLHGIPDRTYLYSDINFEALGELVRRVSGESLESYCERHIFTPLQMHNTRFLPPDSWRRHIAPTLTGLRGTVHDPVARRMGGVAGHAGLFADAGDLVRFARMLLNNGELDGVRILKSESVALLRTPQSPLGAKKLRGLGWDLAAPLSANRLALPAVGAYGHTGYTGTSLWIDPLQQTYSIILTNRVYPNDRAKIATLRDDIAQAIGDALGFVSEQQLAAALPTVPMLETRQGVLSGLDVLEDMQFAPLREKRIGLITNHTARDHDGNGIVDLFRANKLNVVALFSPEHGLEGLVDRRVDSGIDSRTQLPVYSLYGKTLRPTPEMLKDIDVLVFDIQDAGARFYTYISTLGYTLEAAAQHRIDYYVLDRPNPIGAHRVQGPVLDADLQSFTAYFPMPVAHGMTVGELARLFNSEKVNSEKVNPEKVNAEKTDAGTGNTDNKINARLRVIPMRNYRRDMWFDQTGLSWINPSPNLRSPTEAILYPAVGIVEAASVSVGRGTSQPFELVGAPWLDGVKLARYLRQRQISGVQFRAARFTPTSSIYQGKLCHGVKILLTDRDNFDAPLLGVELASALQHMNPRHFDLPGITGMIGARSVVEAIKRGEDPQAIARDWHTALAEFVTMRNRYLLY